MVSEYIRGQSDLRALSLLEELKYVLLQQDMHIAKQAIEIERLNKENEKLRGEVSRLKESPSLFSDADMNSAPNSPKAERREEDMKSEKSEDDSESDEPKELVPKMIFRLNKEKESEKEQENQEKRRETEQELAEVINPANIKEAKENINKSISQALNRREMLAAHQEEMARPPLLYDPTLARQNPQGPPQSAQFNLRNPFATQSNRANNEHELGNEENNNPRSRRSESLPNTTFPPQQNPTEQINQQMYQTTAFQRRHDRQNLSRTGCGGELQQFNQYVDNGVYDQVYGYGFSDSFNNSVDQQNTLHPMYQTWQLGPTPMTATQDGYGQALTPNSTSSSNLDPSSDQPRARKLNENCRCSYCNKCFQSTWHLKRHERTHTNEKPYNCQKLN